MLTLRGFTLLANAEPAGACPAENPVVLGVL